MPPTRSGFFFGNPNRTTYSRNDAFLCNFSLYFSRRFIRTRKLRPNEIPVYFAFYCEVNILLTFRCASPWTRAWSRSRARTPNWSGFFTARKGGRKARGSPPPPRGGLPPRSSTRWRGGSGGGTVPRPLGKHRRRPPAAPHNSGVTLVFGVRFRPNPSPGNPERPQVTPDDPEKIFGQLRVLCVRLGIF